VNQVDGNDVAAARHLYFYADANVARPSVDGLLFDPINATAFPLRPAARGFELLVDFNPKDLSAIRVLAFLDEKLELRDELPDFA
jgi:hypothetical protein